MIEDLHQRLRDLADELEQANQLVSAAHVQFAADILFDDLVFSSCKRNGGMSIVFH